MTEVPLVSLIVVGVSLVLSAFFSSSETAFFSLQKTRIIHLVSTRVSGAKRVARMMEEPERLLSTILLGNNLVNITFASLVTVMTVSFIGDDREGLAVVVATVIGTSLILVFGEIMPKSLAVRNAQTVAFVFARPLKLIEVLLFPLVVVLQWIGRAAGALVRGENRTAKPLVSEDEFRTLIDVGEAEGSIDPGEAEMLESVFRFGDRQVREVMRPRTEMIAIERGASLGDFLEIYATHAHTRFPVYKGSVDNIVGIVSSKDVLRALSTRETSRDEPITHLIRDAYFVPETKRIAELFDELRRSGNQFAIPVDEFGGVAGLVTIKQLLEEVVGRVGEEGTSPEEEYVALGEDTYQVDGGMSIEEVNDRLDLRLPEGDFETVAGFVLDVLGHIPTSGERLEYGGVKLEVTRMRDMKIEQVRLTKTDATNSQEDALSE